MLFLSIDKSLNTLMNFVVEARNQQSGHINNCHSMVKRDAYQQTLSILFSIWQSNNILRLTVQQFQSTFTRLVKSNQRDQQFSIQSLQFNYERFGQDSQIEKIVLRLIEKNLKKGTGLYKMSIVIKI